MFNYKLNYKLPKKIKGRIKEYLLLYENYSCFPIIMDPCNFFFLVLRYWDIAGHPGFY